MGVCRLGPWTTLAWGGGLMGKILSDNTKQQLSKRLGVSDVVQREGWGGVSARQCGNLVREAIKYAEEQLKS